MKHAKLSDHHGNRLVMNTYPHMPKKVFLSIYGVSGQLTGIELDGQKLADTLRDLGFTPTPEETVTAEPAQPSIVELMEHGQALLELAWVRSVVPTDIIRKGTRYLHRGHSGSVSMRIAERDWDAEDFQEEIRVPVPTRPSWVDEAPAVRAWHWEDGRVESDGTPAVKRVWSPDYRQRDTWSTPSLQHVPWTELVEVEPLA